MEQRRGQLTEARWERMAFVAARRTRWIRVVLEDIYQGHNASAILRTCDCFGVQDIHAIELRNRFKANDEIALGASNWLTVRRWDEAAGGRAGCLQHLRAQGCSIAVTYLGDNTTTLEELPIDRPIALCFGTEKDGITPELLAAADHRIRIPMHGFTQSFNVSVTAALCLHTLTTRLHASPHPWRLSDEEREILLTQWAVRQTHAPDTAT